MKLSRRTLIKTGLSAAALVACGGFPTKWLQKLEAAPGFQTTVARTFVLVPVPLNSPKVLLTDLANYKKYGYGVSKVSPGLAIKRRLDIMAPGYNYNLVTKKAKLLRFFAITDVHITDKECPTQAIYLGLKNNTFSAYSGVMLYTTHVLNAAVQTINGLHAQDPIDFGISLGDICNNTQYNETRWYIDILDGKQSITPSSGAHAGATTIDYQKPYNAPGLNKAIPWYQALGNHDHFWMGVFPVSDYLRQSFISSNILLIGNAMEPGGLNRRDYYMGVLDGGTPYGTIIGAGPVGSTNPPKVVADPDRRSLSKKDWMKEFFKTTANPIGHGFKQTNIDHDFASYSFEPKTNIPIKVIVLDNTQTDQDREIGTFGHGTVDKVRYDWLVSELDKGQAEGKLMIIAAHVPIGVERPGSPAGWSSTAYVSEPNFIAKLNSYPNLILWMAGHRHVNTVTAFKSPNASRPELGFWQIETASLRDFPQQFRTFDIFKNSNNTLSIVTVAVDPIGEEGSPAAISRSYAIGAQEIARNAGGVILGQEGAYNAELIIQLSQEMQAKIQKI